MLAGHYGRQEMLSTLAGQAPYANKWRLDVYRPMMNHVHEIISSSSIRYSANPNLTSSTLNLFNSPLQTNHLPNSQ